MKKEFPKRKTIRLQGFDYNTAGAYFVTICTNNRKAILSPTTQHSAVAQFVSTFKRFCNKEYGSNIWQRYYNDHIIRNERDYKEHAEYIVNNPITWQMDKLYIEVN